MMNTLVLSAVHPLVYLVGHRSALAVLCEAAEAIRLRGVGVAAAHELADTVPLAEAVSWQADRLMESDAVLYVGDWIARPEAGHLTRLASALGKPVVAFESLTLSAVPTTAVAV